MLNIEQDTRYIRLQKIHRFSARAKELNVIVVNLTPEIA